MSLVKSLVVGAAMAGGLVAAQAPGAAVASETPKAKTVVLVHGAFADGSSWNKVIPFLTDAGLNVISVQNPLESLEEDVAYTKRAIEAAEGPVTLVGHSWGGMVITEAGVSEKVSSLVYVAAFAPSKGQQLVDTLQGYETPPGFKQPIKDAAGFLSLSEKDIVNHFAHDLPEAEARLIAISQGAIHDKAIHTPVTQVAWEQKPSHFIVSEQDHMIPPDLLRAFAEKIDADTTSLPASHVPMLSMPRAVADVILDAAGAE